MASVDPLRRRLDALLSARTYPKSICPSEVARALTAQDLAFHGAAHWRDLMPDIRARLWQMRVRGEVDILQRGEPIARHVALEDIKGPIRARRVKVAEGS
ncbi:uncharacterized protein K452DRAFT_234186 [Aplosporella prunicola CBS 121167]|uniref:DUF3253 domain-containing protein n=1 Tax=Aplosporella prunicola CBS 121167 TaxID=1176127 RepID=A0A6A6B2L4_9PEZI|nr:uncharacterized protein K452DRAFT_234186 [Aplosporella prunicola CBS 121167]KAF2138452.1 hypothetical protein K452DRAFT_234186 [Aplosporella prunicola CBS 121167]